MRSVISKNVLTSLTSDSLEKDFIIPSFSATKILLLSSSGDCKSKGLEKDKFEKAFMVVNTPTESIGAFGFGLSANSSLSLHETISNIAKPNNRNTILFITA